MQIIFSVIFIAFFICVASVLAKDIDCSQSPTKWTAYEAAKCGLEDSASQGYLGSRDNIEDQGEDGMITNLPATIGKIVGAGLSLLGVVFLLLIIYGGLIWMIARGNEQKVEQAKTTIEAAVIGLVIVLAAYAITYFIGQQLT